tara:strand:- start:1433 stop:2107 length:675 start_codon:yes stop_codon:yes gene_type:complete
MAFPPQFSSTETYANRYDLDEIDVYLEGNSNNPMFFEVSGLPTHLSFGKHYFYISMLDASNQNYRLRGNSQILFEFKSTNNVVLRSDVVNINQKNGIASCFVEILKDPLRTMKEVEDGEGTLTIVGSLEKNVPGMKYQIPPKFRDAINYRCKFPINIAKNIIGGNSPIITNTESKTETIKGQYSFAKASISPLKTSAEGMTYNDNTGLPDRPIGDFTSGGSGKS